MVTFSSGEKKLFIGTVVFNITFNGLCLIVALHNILRYVCKPRHSKFLINIFYAFIVAALSSKIAHDFYMLIEREKIYTENEVDYLENFLLLTSMLEDGLYIIYILMTFHLTLAIMLVFGQIDEKKN